MIQQSKRHRSTEPEAQEHRTERDRDTMTGLLRRVLTCGSAGGSVELVKRLLPLTPAGVPEHGVQMAVSEC